MKYPQSKVIARRRQLKIVAPSQLGEEFNRRKMESVSPNQTLVFPSLDMTADLNKDQEVFAELVMYANA